MRKLRLLIFILGLFASASACAAPRKPPPIIAGYIFPQHSNLALVQIDPHSVTRFNYAFANIEDGRMIEGYPEDAANIAFVAALRKQNPSLTVLISVGGWLWSGGFSDAALTQESRARFIDSVIEFIERYDLDGLDVDWEFPGMAGAGHAFRAEDKQNYTALLKDLRERFDAEEKKAARKLYLTVAAGASGDFLTHTEMGKVARYVDDVNLMTYDYYVPGSGPTTGHVAALFADPRAPHLGSADDSVRYFEEAGVPAKKIVLGVPFYGRVWTTATDAEHGLYQPGKPGSPASAPFNTIEATMLNHGYTRYWDSVSQVPWLFNTSSRTFVSYEDEQSIEGKCRYVLAKKLAGMMFWEFGNDPERKLLKRMDACLE